MSATLINRFIEVTDCDRRTAAYCLHRFNNNIEVAISFYFDNSFDLNIPETFMPELTDRRSTSTLSISSPVQSNVSFSSVQINVDSNEPQLSQQTKRIYPIEPKYDLPDFLVSNPPKNPEFFFPCTPYPYLRKDFVSKLAQSDSSSISTDFSESSITNFSEYNHHAIRVFLNGIQIDKEFIDMKDDRYSTYMKDINQNFIPKGLFTDNDDVEIDFYEHEFQN